MLNEVVAVPEGLEPSTCRLEVGRSIQLSYGTAAALLRQSQCNFKCAKPGFSGSRRSADWWRNCRRTRRAVYSWCVCAARSPPRQYPGPWHSPAPQHCFQTTGEPATACRATRSSPSADQPGAPLLPKIPAPSFWSSPSPTTSQFSPVDKSARAWLAPSY